MQHIKYIKELLIILSLIGLSGTIAGTGTGDLFIILISLFLLVSCSIGACCAEEMEEQFHVEPLRKLPEQKIQKRM
jgi:hypothetical protein